MDLDEAVPVAKRMQNGELREPFFVDQTVELGRGEWHTFEILARTSKYFSTWEIRLDLLVDGRPRTMTIRDRRNQPFRTTAWSSSYEAAFLLGQIVPGSQDVSEFVSVEPAKACAIAKCASRSPGQGTNGGP